MSNILDSDLNISKKTIKTYKIKEGTRVICREAFADCKELEDIELPNSLNFIGERAFSGCIKLEHIYLPDSLVYIGDQAFDCEGHGCLRDGSQKRRNPFIITIPLSVEMINGNPFCSNSIIHNNSKKFKVVDNVLYSADGTILISYCSTKEEFAIPYGVVKIGVGAFRYSPIKRVYFPTTLEVIDEYAFAHTENLECISFPESLREIHKHSFEWCDFQTGHVSLPANIKEIDPEAFGFDWYIKIVQVPKGQLEHYKSIIPNYFSNRMIDEDIVCELGLFMNTNRTELIAAYNVEDNIVIPNGVIKIRDNAFNGIYTINSITFPESLKTFSMDMFDEEIIKINHIYVPAAMQSFFIDKLPKYKNVIEASFRDENNNDI